ncbi:hypothetical protein TraAM80_08239 [Trypanosoma rangeli]|uniref:Uncharacterized protein n=1 Tax=Trypanosoma rangeli TaxID=5698 RepID=A0A3R7NA14_TRYRA|nr:uncharacterized protein TraAM80_08239 [Trypanosoma rangeli]RNE99352.1 hypothetical protein TraAM80_08239 [Trypanosoma rangeli]|eukprot:RNE99352.1 hypothetical protein TraAM80_08239 [Trypanosoma rangeli]
MRRTTAHWVPRLLSAATTKYAAPPSFNGDNVGDGADSRRGAGLFFADRAVKVTRLTSPGLSFSCTPSILSCEAPDATAAVRLVKEEPGQVPAAKIQLAGLCAVSLFRSHRIVLYCTGEVDRVQHHEVGLRSGDVLVVLRGCDRMRDWSSVERTLRSVAGEDPEYIAEEVLLRLASDAHHGPHASASNEVPATGVPNGVCIMTVVRHRPSARLPQPPFHLHCSIA